MYVCAYVYVDIRYIHFIRILYAHHPNIPFIYYINIVYIITQILDLFGLCAAILYKLAFACHLHKSNCGPRFAHLIFFIFCCRSYILRWPQFTVEVRSCFSHLNNISQLQYNLQAGAYNNSQVVFSCTRWTGDFFVLWKISRLVGVIANKHHWEAPESGRQGARMRPLMAAAKGSRRRMQGCKVAVRWGQRWRSCVEEDILWDPS